MAVKIRLTRTGRKKLPSYRVVVADSQAPRDGRLSASSPSSVTVRCATPRGGVLRPPGDHSLRSRHSRAAASPPTLLPSLTVPRWVRLGRAPRRTGRISPLGARPLQERISGCRGLRYQALATFARSLPVP